MLEADQRIRASGIEPNAPQLPSTPAGQNELNVARCARQLAESGYDAQTVDAKMLHIVAVAEAEARRERHRRWFKPALIWDPERANRAADTSIEEAQQKRGDSSFFKALDDFAREASSIDNQVMVRDVSLPTRLALPPAQPAHVTVPSATPLQDLAGQAELAAARRALGWSPGDEA